MDQPLKIKVS